MSAFGVRGILRTCRSFNFVSARTMSDHGGPTVETMKEYRSTISDMPVPSGSWQEAYNEKNRRLNTMLGSVIVALTATVLFMSQTKSLYLHGLDIKKVNINP